MRPRLSPALIVAVLALVAALAGTAAAGSTVSAAKKKSKHADAAADTTLFKKLLKNATSAPKLSVKHAATADHATTADSATTAGDASTLGGLSSSAFQRSCKGGAVAAYVYVKGSATFSSTYTSSTAALPNQFNCTGGGVQVKRVSAGLYDVRLPGLANKNLLVAASNQTVTPAGVAVNGGSNTYKLVADATIGNEQVWEVNVRTAAAAAVDNEFSFALLSPTTL